MNDAPRTMDLGSFQRLFSTALLAENSPHTSPLDYLFAQPGFSIYRNTVAKGCIDALEANYPTVTRLVGPDWFRAAAALYVAESPPDDSRLLSYGDNFPTFLAQFGPAAALPYLPHTARLDRFWTEVHTAADATAATGADITPLHPDVLAKCVLHPHPAARWAWFDGQPIFSIWQQNRAASTLPTCDLVWQGEGALLTRPNDAVAWCRIGVADCAFLDACDQGKPLAAAARAALQAQANVDLAHLFHRLLQAGALTTPIHFAES